MRPSAGGDALAGRSRKSSLADATTPLAAPGHGTQTTFFLANEGMMERSSSRSDKEGGDSAYGVESLNDTLGVAEEEDDDDAEDDEEDHEADHEGNDAARRRSTLTADISRRFRKEAAQSEHGSISDSTPSASCSQPRHLFPIPPSQPLTPISSESPAPGSSLPSSPKSTSTRSYRHSDEDSLPEDAGSQAIMSSGDEGVESPPERQGNTPQLIMPSIKMPSRRPFTARGKSMGRLKMLIAGDAGTLPLHRNVDIRQV